MAAAMATCEKNRTLEGFSGADKVDGNSVLTMKCDILVPAALGGVLTADNAEDVKARYIVEGANGPTDPEADEVFDRKGIHVVPDIYANCGGVTVSYFEWSQNMQHFYWEEDRVNTELRKVMKKGFANLLQVQATHKCNLRMAAFILGVMRVREATEMRGL